MKKRTVTFDNGPDLACTPIRDREVVGSLDGLVCGDEPEPPDPRAS